jgi:hypothetical protein
VGLQEEKIESLQIALFYLISRFIVPQSGVVVALLEEIKFLICLTGTD